MRVTTLQIAEFTLRLRLEAFKDLRNPSDDQVAEAVDGTVDLYNDGFSEVEWNIESAIFTALDILDGIVDESFDAKVAQPEATYLDLVAA